MALFPPCAIHCGSLDKTSFASLRGDVVSVFTPLERKTQLLPDSVLVRQRFPDRWILVQGAADQRSCVAALVPALKLIFVGGHAR